MKLKYNSSWDGMLKDLKQKFILERKPTIEQQNKLEKLSLQQLGEIESRNLGYSTREEEVEAFFDDLTNSLESIQ